MRARRGSLPARSPMSNVKYRGQRPSKSSTALSAIAMRVSSVRACRPSRPSASRPSAEVSYAETINETLPANRIKVTKRSVESLRPGSRPRLVRRQARGFRRARDAERPALLLRALSQQAWPVVVVHDRRAWKGHRRRRAREGSTDPADGSGRCHDPSGEREAFRAAPTVNDLFDRYIADHVEAEPAATQDRFNRIAERDIRPELGHLKVASVTRQDMHKFHARSATPRQANLILAMCSKAFSLAEIWEMRPEGTNPCRRSNVTRRPSRALPFGGGTGPPGATLRRAESEGLPWKNGRRTLYRRGSPPRDRLAAVHRLPFIGGAEPTLGAHRFRHRSDQACRYEIWPAHSS